MANITKWRGPRRKLLTAKAANQRFSRKHNDWVLPFDITCAKLCLDPGVVCPSGFALNLLSNAQLTTAFDGATRIAKIRGRLYFQAHIVPLGDLCENINDAGRTTYMRLGLKKVQGVDIQGPFIPDSINPMRGSLVQDPTTGYGRGDWTEQKWLKTWEHSFMPRVELGARSELNGSCCAYTAQATYEVPATVTGSQPAYQVPAVTTDCIPEGCGPPEETCLPSVKAQFAPTWSVGINYARPISMTGSDVLNLWGGWETMQDCGDLVRPPQATLAVWGSIKMLVERG